jgi:hypothetical protein
MRLKFRTGAPPTLAGNSVVMINIFIFFIIYSFEKYPAIRPIKYDKIIK